MIPCPACKRRVFTHREILGSNIEGWAQCPACGRVARLDQLSRVLVSCTLALLLWLSLLHGDIFFSGYLFLFSMVFILGGWRLIAAAALPLLSIEKAPGGSYLSRRQSAAIVAALVALAIAIDALLSYRSEADKADPDTTPRGVNTRSI